MTDAHLVGMSLWLEEIAALGENLPKLAVQCIVERVLYISECENQYSLPVKMIATTVKVAVWLGF